MCSFLCVLYTDTWGILVVNLMMVVNEIHLNFLVSALKQSYHNVIIKINTNLLPETLKRNIILFEDFF